MPMGQKIQADMCNSAGISQEYSDLISEPQSYSSFISGDKGRQEDGTLRVLSIFSGCGGMDLGLEGGFICHRRSVTNGDHIHHAVNDDWVMLQRNAFRTVFACDILEEARLTWVRYMSRFGVNPNVYHLESIVDLVKQHREGRDVFPHDIDIVTGGLCQDFSVAGKRKGSTPPSPTMEEKRGRQAVRRDQRQAVYVDETGH